ncbi:MAG: hemerythrin domain-containing protein [Acidimicrobiia bacterium]
MPSLDFPGGVPGLAELIVHEHRVIDGLLAALGSDREDRFPLAHRLVDEVAAHSAAVTQVLLPALRDIVPGGAEMANQGQTRLQELGGFLSALEQGHPGDPDFEAAVVAVSEAMGRHVPGEENQHLPALSAVIGPDAMGELGRVYARIRENTPSGLQAMPVADANPRFRTQS